MDSAIHLINKSCNSFCYPLFGIIPRQGLFLSPQNTFHWRAGSWSSESVMNKVFIWLWNLDNWFWAKISPSDFDTRFLHLEKFDLWMLMLLKAFYSIVSTAYPCRSTASKCVGPRQEIELAFNSNIHDSTWSSKTPLILVFFSLVSLQAQHTKL